MARASLHLANPIYQLLLYLHKIWSFLAKIIMLQYILLPITFNSYKFPLIPMESFQLWKCPEFCNPNDHRKS